MLEENILPYTILLKAVKIGEKNFGELLVICQIRQSFFTANVFTIRYALCEEHCFNKFPCNKDCSTMMKLNSPASYIQTGFSSHPFISSTQSLTPVASYHYVLKIHNVVHCEGLFIRLWCS